LNKRRASRFAAVQALYQVDLSRRPYQDVVGEFEAHRLDSLFEPLEPSAASPSVDRGFFRRLVKGVSEERQELDAVLEAALLGGWTLDRCGFMLRACLRGAAYELAQCNDVPINVVINEYVDLAKLFLPNEEPAFVNAVLDRLASRLRKPEVAKPELAS
jgi:transcription antitermination protein NusB